MFEEFTENGEKVFVLRKLVEVRFPLRQYEKLRKKFTDEYIISYGEPKRVVNRITGRNLVFVTRESGLPLLGSVSFGLIDRGTNLIQVRPATGCNLNCIYCSVDEGKASKSLMTDYIVEPDYLAEKVKEIAEFKGDVTEIHIDGQGEPLLYPYIEELLEKVKKIKEVSVISIQTNGTVIDEKLLDVLENYVTRINLSISSLDWKLARVIHRGRYELNKILDTARMIAESKMDLLIAPVWIPRYNDGEIEKLINFALEIGAGKKYPPLGIQKYIRYKHGRKLKNVVSFNEFYSKLAVLEREYGVKLILKPEDFGMEKRRKIRHPIRKGQRLRAKLVCDGRMFGEKIAVVNNRVVTVKTDRKVGDTINFEIVRDKDGIFLAC
ncbi:MAG TPA: radical SAM protein [Archaeoglobaceae archaeon]|nr:radical SAM protein [Archaeoglobaceae archaeon]